MVAVHADCRRADD